MALVGADGRPLGMAVNSFTSVSLAPPLDLFGPARSSTKWPILKTSERFALEVLLRQQTELARTFARSGGDNVADVALWASPDGLPALEGTVARLVCELQDVHTAGDHEIAVGLVQHAEYDEAIEPLLFHR